MDEYERAAFELKSIAEVVGIQDYARIVRRRKRTLLFGLNNYEPRRARRLRLSKYIRDALSINLLPVEDKQIPQSEIGDEIDKMLAYTAAIFEMKQATIG